MSDQTETNTEQPQVPEQILIAYGMVFNQLLQSDKFRLFMDTYYTVQRLVDEEKKEITLQVIENPPEVIGKKITEAAALAMKEEAGKIQIVSESMGKKIVDKVVAGAKKKR